MYRNLGSLPIENWIPGKKIDIRVHTTRKSVYIQAIYVCQLLMQVNFHETNINDTTTKSAYLRETPYVGLSDLSAKHLFGLVEILRNFIHN